MCLVEPYVIWRRKETEAIEKYHFLFSFSKRMPCTAPRMLLSINKRARVAHELARVALSLKENCIWVDEAPGFILEALVNDVTMFDNQ